MTDRSDRTIRRIPQLNTYSNRLGTNRLRYSPSNFRAFAEKISSRSLSVRKSA